MRAAWPTDKLDLGARFSSGFGDIEATTYVWGLANFTEWAGRDAKFHVKVKDMFVPAFGLGARYRITPAIEVGAAWSSAVDVEASGTGDAVQGSGVELGPGQRPTIIPIEDSQAFCNKRAVEEVAAAGGLAEAATAPALLEQIEIEIKYEGYLKRQAADAARLLEVDRVALALDLDYAAIPGLSREVIEKLSALRPVSVGQAARIDGSTTAAVCSTTS